MTDQNTNPGPARLEPSDAAPGFVQSEPDQDHSRLHCPCGATFTWTGYDDKLFYWEKLHRPHLSHPTPSASFDPMAVAKEWEARHVQGPPSFVRALAQLLEMAFVAGQRMGHLPPATSMTAFKDGYAAGFDDRDENCEYEEDKAFGRWALRTGAAKPARGMARVLLDLEWKAGTGIPMCPVCLAVCGKGQYEPPYTGTHKKKCALAAALRKAGVQVGVLR